MRDRGDGVRRAVLRRSPGLGPHAKIPRLESLQAQSWAPHRSHTAVELRCELAIKPSWTMAAQALRERMAALARSEHERAARRLPAAALFAVWA